MKKIGIFFVYVVCVLSMTALISADSSPDSEQAAVQAALNTFKNAYSTEIVIGKPIEVNNLKLIPLATVGVGFAPYQTHREQAELKGAGGVLMPVGIIVVSGQHVKIVPISKGFIEQVVSALAPMLLHMMNFPQDTAKADSRGLQNNARHPPSSPPEKENFTVTYWKWMFTCWVIWLIIACIVQKLLPDKISALTATLRFHAIQISIYGFLGFGAIFLLVIIFTISIIGIPFTFALFILAAIFTVFGTIGLALFIGQESATAFKYHYSDMRLMLIGGILFGLLGMIPFVGIAAWAVIAVFGLGTVLQAQRENLIKKYS